jgi:hypothetical protein
MSNMDGKNSEKKYIGLGIGKNWQIFTILS